MSKSPFGDLGLGLLWLPLGLLFIVAIVAGLFMVAHDSPSHRLTSAYYQPIAG